MSEIAKKRSWFRGRVWLIAILACLLLISFFVGGSLIRSRRENAAIQRLQAIGVKIDLMNTAPSFLKNILGEDLLEGFRSVSRINAGEKTFTDADLFAMGNLNYLHTLDLRGTQITDDGLRRLQNLPKLRTLKLAKTRITDEGLKYLHHLPELDHLDLSGTRVTGEGLIHAAELTQLRSVYLDQSDLSDEGLNQIFLFPKLTLLIVNDTGMAEQITDQGLAGISQARSLQMIHLAGTSITDAGVKNMAGLPKLSGLSLSRTKITDNALQTLGNIKSLRTLNLNETNVGGAGLKFIANSTKMSNLWLARTKVSHADLVHLQNMKELHSLWLHGTDVTFSDLKVFSGMSALSILTIGHCETFSDADVDLLSSFPELKSVFSADLPITHEVLRKLSQIRQLESVWTTKELLRISDDELKVFTDTYNLSVAIVTEEKITP